MGLLRWGRLPGACRYCYQQEPRPDYLNPECPSPEYLYLVRHDWDDCVQRHHHLGHRLHHRPQHLRGECGR